MLGGANPVSSPLQKHFEAIVYELPERKSTPTVRHAAREYIVAHHLASKDQHQLAIAHFRRCAELDKFSPAPWSGMAISFAATGRKESAIIAWNEVLSRVVLYAVTGARLAEI